jgi:hypothetical protein
MIKTRYIPATNFAGSKIRAFCNGKRVSIPYPHELSGEAVHRAGADAWAKKHGRTLTGAARYNERTGGYSFPLVCP